MRAVKNQTWRYMGIAIVFCLVSVIYLGRLFYIQISGRGSEFDGATTTRTVTIQAVRGEIYDRNGKALVTNRYTYDLTLSHEAFSRLSTHRANEVCLGVLEALNSCGEADKHEERYFPFEGSYPYYLLSEEAQDGDSIPYYRLQRVLGDIGLEKDASVEEIVEAYVKTYSLLATDSTGKRLYDDDEIDRLIRMRYDMDAVRFASAGEYTVAEEVGMGLMTYVKELSLAAVSFQVNVERVYNYPGYASHILGTVGPIYSEEWEYYNEQGYQMNAIVGKSGCELAFEQYLHGSDGKMEIVEDAAGNLISATVTTPPVAGSDVRLTIDIDLQIAAEDGLAENVQYVVSRSQDLVSQGSGCNAGAAVAMDPNTFEVLALASYPTYDLSTYNLLYNELAANTAKPLINRALNGTYAPGSTFKPGVAAVALTEGEITATSTIHCGGKYTRYDDYQPKCSTYPHSWGGSLTAAQAIADSCNCFFYELGYRLGIDRLDEYMKKFGFGQSTGLELGGATGVLAGPDYRQQTHGAVWTEGLTLQAAIGQSDNQASPIQLACYLSALVNGGTRYAAHLLYGVYAFGSDTPSYTYAQDGAVVLDSISLSDSARASVFSGLRQVVTGNATVSRNMKGIPVPVGGKTGTAQNSSGCDNALFICAAPYDAPEIVISVVLEQGYSGGYSSLTAARILEKYYNVNAE